MDMSTRQKLAELIQKDIDQLREKAEGQGVTAWLTRPAQRERPNERFLVSTLRGVQAHNRRAEEEEMWERYRQRRQREKGEEEAVRQQRRGQELGWEEGGHRCCSQKCSSSRSKSRDRSKRHSRSQEKSRRNSRSPEKRWEGRDRTRGWAQQWSPGRSGEAAGLEVLPADAREEEEEDLSDETIAAMIASKSSRGRGGVGSRMDVPGPYLPLIDDAAELANEDTAVVQRRQLGPACPQWLQQQEEEELIAMADAWQEQRRRLKPKQQRHSSGNGSSSDGGSASDSSSEWRRKKRRRTKKEKKQKKKRKKERK